MAELEKVISGLEHCNHHSPICRECPYITEDMTDENETQCFDILLRNALELLKDQDNQIHHMRLIIEEYEKELQRNPVIVCPHCGKRVK